MVINIFSMLITFVFMEFAAWWSHKHIMHGILWYLHSDHHKKNQNKFLEMNDIFALIFALPSMILLTVGLNNLNEKPYFWIGLGILLYGVAYFFVHDVFIHQRIKLFRRVKGQYLQAMKKAHKIHHKNLNKENGVYFGFLWVPKHFFEQEKQTIKQNR